MELQPNAQDYRDLWALNPLANEQLKVIILQRMYGELLTQYTSNVVEDEKAGKVKK